MEYFAQGNPTRANILTLVAKLQTVTYAKQLAIRRELSVNQLRKN